MHGGSGSPMGANAARPVGRAEAGVAFSIRAPADFNLWEEEEARLLSLNIV